MAAARVLTSTSEVAALDRRRMGPRRTVHDSHRPRRRGLDSRSYDVNQDHDGDHLVVSIALAERVDQDWIRWYQRLARVKGIGARRRSSGGEQRQDGYSRLRCARSHPRVTGYRTGLVHGSRRGAGEAATDRRSRVRNPLLVVRAGTLRVEEQRVLATGFERSNRA